MAASKRKEVKQSEHPKSMYVGQTEDPDHYYDKHPTWCFNSCDKSMWGFTKDHIGDVFWSEILPFLQGLETQTWKEILVGAKKHHHSINVAHLNAAAQKRLVERYIEADAVVSLSLSGTHRIYGYMNESVFNVLWYDENHGDNAHCVCRSNKKHT